MTKRKSMALILLVVFLLYSVSAFIILDSVGSLESDRFRDRVSSVYGSLQKEINYIVENNSELKNTDAVTNKDCTFPELLLLRMQQQYTLDYPYIIALKDESGNIVARTKPALYVEDYDANRNFVTSFYIDLEDYLTDELRAELGDFLSSINWRPDLEYVSFSRDLTGKIIPSKIGFLNQREDTVVFSLAERSPSDSASFLQDNIYLSLHRIGGRKSENKCWKILDEAFEKFKTEEFKRNGGGGFQDYNSHDFSTWITIDGKDYNIFFASEGNIEARALTSDNFRYLIINLANMFVIIGIIILIVFNKLWNKNQRLNESRKAFISAAAHELKTPIAVIQNQCECVIENIAPEKNEEYVKSIHDEAVRMNNIVSSLLTFNRLSNANAVQKEKCSLSEIVRKEKEKYLSFALAKGVTLTEEIADDIFVMCNPELMAMAVDNYLSNAIKYSSGKKQVKITLTENNGQFRLEVFNTGRKIEKTTENDMWEVFARMDKARNSTGGSTGMGLPICKRIFDLHKFNGRYFYRDGVVFEIVGKTQ